MGEACLGIAFLEGLENLFGRSPGPLLTKGSTELAAARGNRGRLNQGRLERGRLGLPELGGQDRSDGQGKGWKPGAQGRTRHGNGGGNGRFSVPQPHWGQTHGGQTHGPAGGPAPARPRPNATAG